MSAMLANVICKKKKNRVSSRLKLFFINSSIWMCRHIGHIGRRMSPRTGMNVFILSFVVVSFSVQFAHQIHIVI